MPHVLLIVLCALIGTMAHMPAACAQQTDSRSFDEVYEHIVSNPKNIFLEWRESAEDITRLQETKQTGNIEQASKLTSLTCSFFSTEKARTQLIDDIQSAKAYAEQTSDVPMMLRLQNCLIGLNYSAQNHASIEPDIQHFLALATESNDPYLICYAHVYAGELLSFQGEHSSAIQQFEAATQQCNTLPEKYGLSRAYIGQSLIYRRIKDYERSLTNLNQVEQQSLLQANFDWAYWHYEKGLLYLDMKQNKQSIDSFEQARARYGEKNGPTFLSNLYINLARAYLADKQLEQAAAAVKQAKAARDGQINIKAFNIGFALMVEAAIVSEMGRPKKALKMFEEANRLVDFSRASQLQQIHLGYRIPNYKALGMHKEAYDAYQTISEIDDHISQQIKIQEKQIIKLKAEQVKQEAVNEQLKLQAEKNARARTQDRIIRRWQYSAIALSSLLALLLGVLIYQEIKRKRKFWQMAYSDALTEVHNRRSIFSIAKRMIDKQKKRTGEPLVMGLMIVDIDHFKQINDQFGHSVGDATLKHAVNTIREGLRAVDHLGRIGGEEFLILIHQADQTLMEMLGNRIKELMQDNVSLPNDEPVTISIGATLFAQGDVLESMLTRADKALYEAKNSGRNQMKFA